jgi:hypothetical protein
VKTANKTLKGDLHSSGLHFYEIITDVGTDYFQVETTLAEGRESQSKIYANSCVTCIDGKI